MLSLFSSIILRLSVLLGKNINNIFVISIIFMINLLNFLMLEISSDNIEGKGGLFDFNATLPLMALQFLVLMIILNITFYKPVTKVLDERDEYIRNSLTTASASLNKANELTTKYEEELTQARRKAQELIRSSQKDAQKNVLYKIKDTQIYIEVSVNEASQQLIIQKEKALKTLESQIDTLTDQIRNKLLEN